MKIDYAALLSRPEHIFDWPAIHTAIGGEFIPIPERGLSTPDVIGGFSKGARILITGAGGSIGSAIARGIINSAPQMLGVVGHSELPIFNLCRELNKWNVVPAIVDIASDGMRKFMERFKPDMIIHAAAHKHVGLMESQPAEAFQNNTEGTIALAKFAQELGIEKFVFISTDKAARPESNMGASKRLAEAWLLANYPEATICRFGNVLGSSGSLLEIAAKKIEASEEVTLTDRRMTRFCITPNEAVGLVLTSGLLLGPGAYILAMGVPVLVEDLIYRLAAQLGKPLSLTVTEAGEGEKLNEDLVNPHEVMRSTAHKAIFSILSNITPGMIAHSLSRVREDIRELKAAAQAL